MKFFQLKSYTILFLTLNEGIDNIDTFYLIKDAFKQTKKERNRQK